MRERKNKIHSLRAIFKYMEVTVPQIALKKSARETELDELQHSPPWVALAILIVAAEELSAVKTIFAVMQYL